MDLTLIISIIKTVSSLETYYVILFVIEEYLWRHLNKNREIKYREFLLYFATKRNVNFHSKLICCIHSRRDNTQCLTSVGTSIMRGPVVIVQSFTSLSDPLPHSVFILQHYPHVYLPTFCIMTQRHCWLGSF